MATKKNTSINGHDYFKLTRTIGHKMVDGKKVPIKKQFYGSSKGDAEKKYKAYLESQARAKYEKAELDDIATLGMRASEYIENVLNSTSKYAAGTKDLYKRAYKKHIKDTWFDQMRARDIKARDLQRFYNELDVTYHALETVRKFMTALFKWMESNEYAANITHAVELPAKEKRFIRTALWFGKTMHWMLFCASQMAIDTAYWYSCSIIQGCVFPSF